MRAELMTRRQLVEFLNENGYPISIDTLNRYCMPSLAIGPEAKGAWGKHHCTTATRPWPGRASASEPLSDEHGPICEKSPFSAAQPLGRS
jgi:hypothetical protein